MTTEGAANTSKSRVRLWYLKNKIAIFNGKWSQVLLWLIILALGLSQFFIYSPSQFTSSSQRLAFFKRSSYTPNDIVRPLRVTKSSLAAQPGLYDIHAHKPLNILFLYADDWRHNTLGVAGNPVIRTPHLDQLAAQGVRFTHACVTTSICGVSRATLQTGQYFSRHKSNPHDPSLGKPDYYQQPKWNTETLVGLLRHQAEYFVGHVGKWHTSWNLEFPADKFHYSTNYYEQHILANGNHVTVQNELDALEFLEKHANSNLRDRPFFLNVAFFATHAEDNNPKQYIPQKKSQALYVEDTIPVEPNADPTGGNTSAAELSFRRLPSFIKDEPINESRARWRKRYATPALFQTTMKNMYRMASEVDSTCGRLIQELKRRGLYDDTLIVFTADNGNFHGEHGLADKWYPHEESVRVPLIVRDPRMPTRYHNTTNDDFVLNVDLAPTLLSASGVSPPYNVMQGRDMAELYLGGKVVPWRTEFYYEHPHINKEQFIPSSKALIRKDYKYFWWPKFEEAQLFHVETDPHEEKDLKQDENHAEVLQEMAERLKDMEQQASLDVQGNVQIM